MSSPATPQTGDLLVSSVADTEGWFGYTVVLMLEADAGGALGVVLNRLSDVPLAAVLPAWVDQVSEPGVMFTGGPVSPDGAICLARPLEPREDPPGWRRSFGDVGLLHLDTPVELVAGAYSGLRIFAGYSGWEAGQLETELADGAWYVVPGESADVFTVAPETLWRRVLRRQPLELAIYASWPADPELN